MQCQKHPRWIDIVNNCGKSRIHNYTDTKSLGISCIDLSSDCPSSTIRIQWKTIRLIAWDPSTKPADCGWKSSLKNSSKTVDGQFIWVTSDNMSKHLLFVCLEKNTEKETNHDNGVHTMFFMGDTSSNGGCFSFFTVRFSGLQWRIRYEFFSTASLSPARIALVDVGVEKAAQRY